MARAGYALGLLSPETDPHNPADACRLIPKRVEVSAEFASVALAAIMKRHGASATAKALEISRATLYARAAASEASPLSLKMAAETIAGLAGFRVGLAEADGLRLRAIEPGPLGQRQVILAWLDWIGPDRFPGDRHPRMPDEAEIYERIVGFVGPAAQPVAMAEAAE